MRILLAEDERDLKELAQSEAELLEKEAENTAYTENDAAESAAEGAAESAADSSTVETFPVTFTKEKLDNDDGLSVYDIEFYTDTAEYEYEISATSGEILSFSMELLNTLSGAASSTANSTPPPAPSLNSRANGTTDVDKTKAPVLKSAEKRSRKEVHRNELYCDTRQLSLLPQQL